MFGLYRSIYNWKTGYLLQRKFFISVFAELVLYFIIYCSLYLSITRKLILWFPYLRYLVLHFIIQYNISITRKPMLWFPSILEEMRGPLKVEDVLKGNEWFKFLLRLVVFIPVKFHRGSLWISFPHFIIMILNIAKVVVITEMVCAYLNNLNSLFLHFLSYDFPFF